MHLKSLHFLLIVSIATFLGGCKLAEKVQEPDLAKMPEQFQPSLKPTLSQSLLPWREYFTDSSLVIYIDEALKSNLDLKIALQRVSMAGASVTMARGALLPSMNAVTSVGQQRFGEYTMDGVGNFDTNFSVNVPPDRRIPVNLPDYYLGFQSSWEVAAWGKLRNRKKAAAARFFASDKAKHLIQTMLVSEVARHYYSLLALDNKLLIIRENVALQQTAVTLITAQKAAGRATELAVKQFTAQLLNTQSLEALVKQEIVRHENELNLLLGRYPQPIGRGQVILNQQLPKELEAGLPSQLLIQRPDIRQAELQLLASHLDVKAARAAFLPSLNLTAGIGLQSFATAVLFNTPTSTAYSILGGLTAPLFNRNMIRGEYRKASASQLESFYSYQQSILQGFQEVATQLNKIENLQESYQFKSLEVTTLEEGVAVSNDLFIAGFASYLEVVTAQKSVLAAELDAIDTKQQQFNATIDLYRALGGGWN
jgi:NodT family efflux transporter outer membrane factor (OMF) lipoprotein